MNAHDDSTWPTTFWRSVGTLTRAATLCDFKHFELLDGEWHDLGLHYCGLFGLGRPRTLNEQQCHDDDDDSIGMPSFS